MSVITLRVVRACWGSDHSSGGSWFLGEASCRSPVSGNVWTLGHKTSRSAQLDTSSDLQGSSWFTSSSSGSLVWLQLPPLFWSGAWQPMPRHFRWAQGLREVGKFGDCFELVNSPSQEQFSFWRTGGCLQVAQQAAPAVFVPQLLFAGFFITTEPGSTFGLAFTFSLQQGHASFHSPTGRNRGKGSSPRDRASMLPQSRSSMAPGTGRMVMPSQHLLL